MAKFEKGNKIGNRFTSETAAEAQRKGAAMRTHNKHGRELMLAILHGKVNDEKLKAEMLAAGFTEKEITHEAALMYRQLQRGELKTDPNAYEKVMKTAGLMKDETDVNLKGEVAAKIAPMTEEEAKAFNEFLKNEF